MSEKQSIFPDDNFSGKSLIGVNLEKAISLSIDSNEII